jgi:hypothetical protein
MPRRRRRRRSVSRRALFEACEPRIVFSAEPMADFFIQHIEAPPLQHFAELQPALGDVHGTTGLNYVRSTYGLRGVGQTVAIIDSGIAWDHVALGGGYGSGYRIVGGWDFAEGDADPYDDGPAGFHGTHVAGIVGNSSSAFPGVAPGVDLVALRVFDDQGAGYFSWVEQALQWVYSHRVSFANPITTVNLSLGTNWNSSSIPGWAMLEDEFAQLESVGIFISVAAGNSFAQYNSPGLSYPAASPYVVPVMSVTNSGTLSSFSQRHARAIGAPGQSITSTVPDHVFGADGVFNDYGTASGTSMAAPYAAGVSVLVREFMQFVGQTGITQDQVYDHLRSTADVFHDTATAADYFRLNVQSAIDSLLPADDYGSTVGTAHSLGTFTSDQVISGTIGQLNDVDYFTFTAGYTGQMSFQSSATHYLQTRWEQVGVGFSNSSNLTFDVVAGQSYTIGLQTAAGIGHYTVQAHLEPAVTDWGAINYHWLADQTTSLGQLYRVHATRSGLFTAEAMFSQAGGNVDLQLLDNSGNVLASSASTTDNERVDVQVTAGQSYVLRVIGANADVDFRLANLVSVSGNRAEILGTAGDDTATVSLNGAFAVTVNGVQYQFAAGVKQLVMDLLAGNDQVTLSTAAGGGLGTLRTGQATMVVGGFSATLFGGEMVTLNGGAGSELHVFDSAGDDRFTATPGSARMEAGGCDLRGNGFAIVRAYANSGGNDAALLFDSAGNDTFVAQPGSAYLEGSGFYYRVSGFARVEATASSGTDTAYLNGSLGNDDFTASPESATLQGSGFVQQASGFDRVVAYGRGGNDTATLYDSNGNDSFVATPQQAYMTGSGFQNNAMGFHRVVAFSRGGTDVAYLHDSAGNDTLVATPSYAYLSGSGFYNHANNFRRVVAFAARGGFDTAYLHDSAGVDTFKATPTFAYLTGAGYYNLVNNFDRVVAYSKSGADQAFLHDSSGNDVFKATATFAYLQGTGFDNHATGFKQVTAYATSGTDTAYLHDSSGDDTFKGTPTYAYLSGTNFYNLANAFDRVVAYSQNGGLDRGYLHDSSGNDVFKATPTFAYLQGSGFDLQASGFRQVMAYGSSGNDTAYLHDSSGNDNLKATPQYTYLSGTNFYSYAAFFKRVVAYSTAGGVDTAYLHDSAGNDEFLATPAYAYLTGLGFHNTVNGFARVQAFSGAGNDTARLYDSAFRDVFESVGSLARLVGTDFERVVTGFARVQAYSSGGGDDAHLRDIRAVDVFTGGGSHATLQRGAALSEVSGFSLVRAYAREGDTATASMDAVDYLFQKVGSWE